MSQAQVTFKMAQGFKQGFDAFVRATGKDMDTLLLEVGRLMTEKAYLYTPPPQSGNKGSRGNKMGGRLAVFEDVMDTMEPRSPGYLMFLQRTFGNEIHGKTLRRKKDGQLYTVNNVVVNASGDVAHAIRYHNRQRKNYNGRVPNSMRSRDVVQNRMMLPNETQQAIASADAKADSKAGELQLRVGMLKSGWAKALRYTRSTRYPDKWSIKAGGMDPRSGKPNGYVKDNLMPDLMTGYLEIGNTTKYMRDNDGFMRRVADEVEKFMGKDGVRLERWFDTMIKKHSRYSAVRTSVNR